eukprot:Clim_evm21s51 gene=Clim_evmTU21s51
MGDGVYQEFYHELQELTAPEKVKINALTYLAEDARDGPDSARIVTAIVHRMAKVKPTLLLSSLYLIDSILKNVGKPYPALFSKVIANAFNDMYHKSDEKTRHNMRRVRATWNAGLFPQDVLEKIDRYIVSAPPTKGTEPPPQPAPAYGHHQQPYGHPQPAAQYGGYQQPQSYGQPANGQVNTSALMQNLLAAGLIKSGNAAPAYGAPQAPPAVAGGYPTQQHQQNPSVRQLEPEPEETKPARVLISFSDPSSLAQRSDNVIASIYDDLSLQCQTCGLRFGKARKSDFEDHMDWHFRENKKEKERATKVFSRKWYVPEEEWQQLKDADEALEREMEVAEQAAEEEEQATKVYSIKVPEVETAENSICGHCGEPFKKFWNEELEEWHYKDAIMIDGQAYHVSCHEDAMAAMNEDDEDAPASKRARTE